MNIAEEMVLTIHSAIAAFSDLLIRVFFDIGQVLFQVIRMHSYLNNGTYEQ